MELNKILKLVILVLLIILAILTIVYKFDDCSKCSFEIDNNKYSAQDMANLYYNKCIYESTDHSQLKPFLPSQENSSEQK